MDIYYRVWKFEPKIQRMVLETTDVEQAFEKVRELAGNKRYAYATLTWAGRTLHAFSCLCGKIYLSDLRLKVRRHLERHR